MPEQLKNPEDYLEKFFSLQKKGDIGAAPRIEKKESRYLPGTGWYELHPFSIDIGHWNKKEDPLEKVDIAAWNAESYDLAKAKRAERERQTDAKNKQIFFPLMCTLLGAVALLAGLFLWFTTAPVSIALILLISGIGAVTYGVVLLQKSNRDYISPPAGW